MCKQQLEMNSETYNEKPNPRDFVSHCEILSSTVTGTLVDFDQVRHELTLLEGGYSPCCFDNKLG